MHKAIAFSCSLMAATAAQAAVFTSEFDDEPVPEGWNLVSQMCDPTVEASGGLYIQQLDSEDCPRSFQDEEEAFRRPIEEFNGSPAWFLEYRVQTTGPSEEIDFAAPTVLAAGNTFGMLYHVTLADDQVRLIRDLSLPILFFDIESGVPHTIRVELREDPGAKYEWYINGQLVDQGDAEDSFPVNNSTVTWQGSSNAFPTNNKWHYIRYGDIPIDASGDFDSDGQVDDFEVFYFDECLSQSAPGVDAGPGCRWADMDSDTDVDCDDYDLFADAWSAPDDPPPIGPCAVGQIIPATSEWGVAIMALLTLTTWTILYTRTGAFTTDAFGAQRRIQNTRCSIGGVERMPGR